MKTRKYLTDYKDIDLELYVTTELIKLNSLHYGYWNNGDEVTIDNFRKAQEKYTETLIKLIPEGVESILDVGCGTGDVAKSLVNKGYMVTAISPDKNHRKYFEPEKDKLVFIESTYEDFITNDKFDLVLMSETQNYFGIDIGFKKSHDFIKPGGYLLSSGILRKSKSDDFNDFAHLKSDYLEAADLHGFKLKTQVDITQEILPSVFLYQKGIQEYLVPASKMVNHFMNSTSPVKVAFFKLLLYKQIRELRKIFGYYQKRCDPEYFSSINQYLRHLFQKEA